MRAICEVCSGAQLTDWKPGDLCIHCGHAVRREARCFWCAKWTPAGKYCRRCGAAVVDDSLYGAARMLREAGTAGLTGPKVLAAPRPEQGANFRRLSPPHAATIPARGGTVHLLQHVPP